MGRAHAGPLSQEVDEGAGIRERAPAFAREWADPFSDQTPTPFIDAFPAGCLRSCRIRGDPERAA